MSGAIQGAPLPRAVRVLNAGGAVLRSLGVPLVRLDASSLTARARRATGLDDLGDDVFAGETAQAGLRNLLDAYESEAFLTVLGRSIAARDLQRLLENRLRITAMWRGHPEIGNERIERPIFILGLPRTGTTILHELLAQDPANRVPMTWETMHPFPPPERATYATDPRIEQVEKHFSGVDRLLPDFKRMHPMGALLPQECVALTAHDFSSMIYHTSNRVPSYQAWLEKVDLRPVYASHRRQLQYLQWRCPGERWVLKSPGHLWALDALLAIYPDARIVQTHRDPLKVVASLVSLVTTLRSLAMRTERIDPLEIARDWVERLARGLEQTMDVRDRALDDSRRVYDLHFSDFIGNEIAAIGKLYAHFDMELGPEARARMQAFLAAQPRDKHGAHTYSFARTGLDAAAARRRFTRYQERFGVPSEAIS